MTCFKSYEKIFAKGHCKICKLQKLPKLVRNLLAGVNKSPVYSKVTHCELLKDPMALAAAVAAGGSFG